MPHEVVKVGETYITGRHPVTDQQAAVKVEKTKRVADPDSDNSVFNERELIVVEGDIPLDGTLASVEAFRTGETVIVRKRPSPASSSASPT